MNVQQNKEDLRGLKVTLGTKRSRLETYAAILDAVGSGAVKASQIMSVANLSWSVFKDSLKLLVSKGLIEEKKFGKRKIYTLTRRGNETLTRLLVLAHDFALQWSNMEIKVEIEKKRTVFRTDRTNSVWSDDEHGV